MKRIKYLTAVIGFCFVAELFFCGCRKKTLSDNHDIIEISFSDVPDSLRLTDWFKNITCVQLEMTDESIIGRVEKIIPIEEELIVFADNEIFLFNKQDGKFIRRIGSIGEGPEEYIEILDLVYDKTEKKIIAYEVTKNVFLTYGLDGHFIDSWKPQKNLSIMASMERNREGEILTCNYVTPTPKDGAFTLVLSESAIVDIDEFTPLHTNDRLSRWAARPMSSDGKEIKFVKCFSDSIFRTKGGEISPLYKLSFGKMVPSKSVISQLGPFPGDPDYLEECISNNWFTGIDKMFETSDFIVIIPHVSQTEGIYWINKRNDTGFRISTTPLFDKEIEKVVSGKPIVKIVGAGPGEIISCFRSDLIAASFEKAFKKADGNRVLSDKVAEIIENVDRNGNPFLLIYDSN